MTFLQTERTYDILSRITNAERLDDVLDLLGKEIDALGLASGYLINMLDASGGNLTCLKIRYPAEYQNLEQSYLGYKFALDDDYLNARTIAARAIVRINVENATKEEASILQYWKICEMTGVPICIPGTHAKVPIGVIVLLKQDFPIPDGDLAKLQELLAFFYQCLASWLRFSHLEQMHDDATAAVAGNKRLLQFLDEMNSLTSVEKIYKLFSAELFHQLPFDIAGFSLIENDQLVMYEVVAAAPEFQSICMLWKQHLVQNPYPLDPTASGAVFVLLRDEAIIFPDLQKISHLPMADHDVKSLAILKTARTLFIAPVRYQKKPIGIFALYSLNQPITLSDADLQLLNYLSSFLGTAITNSKIYATSQAQNLQIAHLNQMLQEKVEGLAEQASTDQLTGLFNFRSFERELEKRMNETMRASPHNELSLLLIDIDHFKQFNDTFGHAAGNEILTGVAHEITRQIRQSDVACRYGGEEFVVILPKCDLDGAVLLAERVRSGIEAAAFATCAGKLSVSVSVGCAMHRPGDDQQSLFNRADQALYQAKENGRNQICSI